MDKSEATLAGGLTVFARDGYSRATIHAIADQAGVSTRTIYNHFADKASLFREVILASSTRVAEDQIAMVDRHLHKIVDLERDLIAFGCDWALPAPEYADHFALVRQIRAEGGHMPDEVLRAWRRAGPERVLAEVSRHLSRMADDGLLRIADPHLAARQLSVLLSLTDPTAADHQRDVTEVRAMVASGVRLFLYGCAQQR